ncbi:MAG: MbtH family NRPS accessory protein [Candidatus Sulfotelmatobacter sp.]|jgi:MbtH protein
MNNSAQAAEERRYKVVFNAEQQYSIWFFEKPVPNGWTEEGTVGTKQECLDHIQVVWVDMRPLSLQRQMAAVKSS